MKSLGVQVAKQSANYGMKPDVTKNQSGRPRNTSLERDQRAVAELLGIGRARVFYLEQAALNKLRKAFEAAGINSLKDLDELNSDDVPETAMKSLFKSLGQRRRNTSNHQQLESFHPAHGWLPVTHLISLNGGTTDPTAVASAFSLLKRDHPREARPPVCLMLNGTPATRYTIEAADVKDEKLFVRCWPIKGGTRSVKDLIGLEFTVAIESEFGEDGDGEFDVPIMLYAIISKEYPPPELDSFANAR